MTKTYIRNSFISPPSATYVNTISTYYYFNEHLKEPIARLSICDGHSSITLHKNSSDKGQLFLNKINKLYGIIEDYIIFLNSGEDMYSIKEFLNPSDNAANGWCSVYHGQIAIGQERCITIGDCTHTIKIKKRKNETVDEYKMKICLLKQEIEKFKIFLENVLEA